MWKLPLGAFLLFIVAAFVALPLRSAPQESQQAAPQALTSPTIVLDPAHGGTDSGARGEGGKAEKDIVLGIARAIRPELERQGFRVLLTRTEDVNLSYDDRAAMANAHRNAIFISLHVASTGTPGTVRTYYEQFGSSLAPAGGAADASLRAAGLPLWYEAQRPYAEASRRLADIMQLQLAQAFTSSPVSSTGVALRGLRSVAGPAVAVEISSISVSDPSSLVNSAPSLASAIVRALLAFRSPGGAN